jgi:hypothetical protein
MKSSLAHSSPTVIAFGAAIGLSLSLLLLSGAGLQGDATPLLPALGSAARSVNLTPPAAPDHRSAPTPGPTPVFTAPPSLASSVSTPTSHPVVHRVNRVHHAPAHARVVRPARPAAAPAPPVAIPAPALSTPDAAPQPVRAPRGNGKALGHQRGHAAKAAVTAPAHRNAPAHGNGHARGHSPEHHPGVPRGQAKKAPAAPTKAKGGGPPADHGGGNGNNGGNGHNGSKK